jgi:hypothetical protein
MKHASNKEAGSFVASRKNESDPFSAFSGYTISYVYGFGWKNAETGEYQATSTNRPPDTTHTWEPIYAHTTNPAFSTGQTVIYSDSFSSFQNLIGTLEHEFAHQNGIFSETVAEQAAVDAMAAWKADKGALCPLNNGGTNSINPTEI